MITVIYVVQVYEEMGESNSTIPISRTIAVTNNISTKKDSYVMFPGSIISVGKYNVSPDELFAEYVTVESNIVSSALDLVAKKLSISLGNIPTGFPLGTIIERQGLTFDCNYLMFADLSIIFYVDRIKSLAKTNISGD